jgi:(E)-4-hydroxy-3-methylbut-2-enyl-diphosphate synthase
MKTKIVKIKNVMIGGENPIAIQSMTNKKNIKDIIYQIHELQDEDCEIVRCAIPNLEMAEAIKLIKSQIKIPLIADIHFDYRLALESIKNGADKIRINPGNIGSFDKIKSIIKLAKQYHVPIRIGINSGSLQESILNKYKTVTPEALVESAINYIDFFTAYNFDDLVISVKSSSVVTSIKAYELLSQQTNHPLHVGITSAGISSIKSSVGIGVILYRGIGDTIRVSMADDPVKEVIAAREILSALEIRKFGIEFVVCPTCGRTKIDLINIAKRIQSICYADQEIKHKKIVVAIMGCAVNGPNEAKNADIGIAGGDDSALLFKKGKSVRKIYGDNIINELIQEIKLM